MGFLELITTCDFIGPKPGFFINKQIIFKTALGGFLSVVISVLLLASGSYFLYSLFSRTNFRVMLNEEYNNFPMKNWTNSEFNLILVDKYMNKLQYDDRIYGIYSDFWWNKPNLTEDGSLKYGLISREIKLEKCNVSKHFPGSEDLWTNQKYINDSTCFARDEPVLYSSLNFGADNYTGIVVWVHKCINTTTKIDCFPEELINSILENTFLLVRFKDYYFNHHLVGQTGVPYVFSDTIQSSISAYKRTFYYFRNVEYINDEGYIFPESVVYNYTNFVSNRDATDLRTKPTVPGAFAVVSLNTFQLKHKYFRSYYKAQNMIADLGGLIKGLLTLATILNYYSSDKLYFTKLVNNNIKSLKPLKADNEMIVDIQERRISRFSIQKDESSGIKLKNLNKIKINDLRKPPKNPHNSQPPLSKPDSIVIDTSQQTFKKIDFSQPRLENHPSLIRLTLSETILPYFCFRKHGSNRANLLNLHKLRDEIEGQMDLLCLLKKLNMVDKISYIFSGTKYRKLFEDSFNPYLKNHLFNTHVNYLNSNDVKKYKEYMINNILDLVRGV